MIHSLEFSLVPEPSDLVFEPLSVHENIIPKHPSMSYCNLVLGTFSGSCVRQTLSVLESDRPMEGQSNMLMNIVM